MNIRAQMRKWLGLDDLVTTKQLSYVIVTIKDQGAITRKSVARECEQTRESVNAQIVNLVNQLNSIHVMDKPRFAQPVGDWEQAQTQALVDLLNSDRDLTKEN